MSALCFRDGKHLARSFSDGHPRKFGFHGSTAPGCLDTDVLSENSKAVELRSFFFVVAGGRVGGRSSPDVSGIEVADKGIMQTIITMSHVHAERVPGDLGPPAA